jgi:outer membrane protein assembly factor BamB
MSGVRVFMPGHQVSGCILIALVVFLVPLIAAAEEPSWIAAGGAPVALSADGGTVLVDGGVFVLLNGKGGVIWKGYGGSYVQSQGEVFSPLALTRDGMYSVLGTGAGLFYVDRSQRLFWQDSEYHPVEALSLSPDENFIASVADHRVSVYSRGGELLWRNQSYPDVESVGISSAGLLTVAGSPGTIHAFNQSGFELWNYSAPGIGEIILSPENSDILAASEYTLLALHPSGNLLWKFYTGDEIRDIAVSGDGSSIAAGNQGGRLFLLDRNGEQVFTSTVGNWVNAVSLSEDGALVAAGGTDRKVYLFERSGRQLLSSTTGSSVKSVAISADGSALAAVSDRVYYYDLREVPGETTPVPSPVTTAPPAVATTTTKAPSATIPETTATMTAPAGTTPTQAASGPLHLIAPAAISLWFALKRRM